MKELKFKLFVILFSTAIFAKDIYPTFILSSKGFVNDFVYDNAKLYVANDIGSIEIFDLQKQERVDEIIIPKLYTTDGKEVNPNILSIDRYKNKILFVSTTLKGFRNVWLHDGKKLKLLINKEKKLAIKKAKFIDEENFMFGTLGHEIILYNTKDNYKTYTKHVEGSAFTDMTLSFDKQRVLTSSESGRVTLSEVKTGKVLEIFESQNVDNIYNISYENGNLITAGQDRRVGVYRKNEKPYYIKSEFMVYSVALNTQGSIGVYSSNEKSHLQLFDVKSGKKGDKLIGHYAAPSKIKFINNKELFSAGYENNIFYWNLYLKN